MNTSSHPPRLSDPPPSFLTEGETLCVAGVTYEVAIKTLLSLGFSLHEATMGMRASYNNPDQALDLLLDGFCSEKLPPRKNAPQAAATSGKAVVPVGSAVDPLAFLRTTPQFCQMRQLVQQNQNLLPSFMRQIRQTNPRLLQMITENLERFVQLLNEPLTESGSALGAEGQSPPSAGAPVVVSQNPESEYSRMSPEEKQAVERLKALGFPEDMCIQAYFACEKNEDLAANFLRSQDFDDEMPQDFDDDMPQS